MVAWTALQWWRVKLDAQGAENVNGGVAEARCSCANGEDGCGEGAAGARRVVGAVVAGASPAMV
ncbi:hypothetical protein DEO72_LG11g1756 [Vigna unguiculata]|uniref:Uncharacterized protein n=1 Tax=Vigna unguiculata TaxID=3917 RepID=A0A4D6NP83_VIGUN|nr:hypothetical protein DEO72_LG11g1756 [Vigna unguiculata]